MMKNTQKGAEAMNVIGYVRVSTDEQATGGISLDAQQAKLEAYAKVYDLNLVEVVVDAGVSAKTMKRPGLQRALSMLKAGKAEGFLVVKLDRLTRSVKDLGQVVETYFSSGKWSLMSVSENIDTRTAAGRLVLNVLGSVAQWEREAIGERTTEALAHKRQIGERVGKVLFGYDLADDGKTLVPNTTEQETLTLVHSLRAQGLSYRAIAEDLTRQHILTKEGLHTWTHTTVARILKRAA